MSAFVVEYKTINRIVSYLSRGRDTDFYQRRIQEELGFNLDLDEGQEQLGQAMFNLNVKAVSQRYDGSVEDMTDFNYQYDFTLDYTPVKTLKSLSCWLYQCMEGNVPNSKLYKLMKDFEREIACGIVYKLDEYKKAHAWR